MLDTQKLNVFMIAAEELNYSKAARRLHMSQPSVTQHIRSLEDHFQKPLFARSGRRLVLTEAGKVLLPLARDMVTLSVRTEEIMEAMKGEVQGHLILGCTTTPGKYVLPSLMTAFLKRYLQVNATINVTSRANALNMLSQGRYHFALTSLFEYNPDIEHHLFLSDEIVMIVPIDHPWAQRTEIEIDDLPEGRFIFREEHSGTYTVIRESLAKAGFNVESLSRVLTLGNTEAIAFAVQEGLGVGFVSRLVANRIGGVRVRMLRIKGIRMVQDVYLLQNCRHPATSAQTAFWQYITDPDNEVRRDILASLLGSDLTLSGGYPSLARID